MSTPTTTGEATGRQRSRMSNPLPHIPEVTDIARSLHKMVHNGSLPPATIGLVHLRVGQLVGSSYFTLAQADGLREAGESEERVTAVATWRDASCFSEAERVALELAEAVLTPNPSGERVPDELYARAAALYDTKALWTLVAAIGSIGFFTPAALIAKPIPGLPPGRNYTD
ncbi:carboxymuconolactone decarboxylase family protein [Streptomyces sp. NPDC014802]|uniref:carboxymuconolactone decarboxylase family protein n=1 Tax=unclassified Streptomyces TaxID=2593676 RepID=UPI0036FBDD67